MPSLPRADTAFAFGAGALAASIPAADNGGYFAGTWSWLALAAFFVIAIRLVLDSRVTLGRLDLLFVVLLVAFGAWILVSSLWAPSLTPVVNEATRMLAYVGVVIAVLLVTRRQSVEALLVGTLVGVAAVSTYALATRVFPEDIGHWEPVEGYRLSDPLGYWNGLGIYAAMGAALAFGLVARGRSGWVKAFAGACLPALSLTILFTFSRGAWLGLIVGLLVAFALDRRRLQLLATALVVLPWSAVAVLYATNDDVLTQSTATLEEFADKGSAFTVVIVLMSVVSAIAAIAFPRVSDRVHVPGRIQTGISIALAVVAVGAVVAVAFSGGPPWRTAEKAWDRFTAPTKTTGANVSDRLIDLSSTGRVDLWRVSWHDFTAEPVAGKGAGTFAAEWARSPKRTIFSKEGHSLYLETLGELGVVGLALLVAALAIPLAAAARARSEPTVTIAIAPYAAFLAHAGVDWDWELAGVTVVALLAATSLVVVARRDASPRELPGWLRIAAPVGASALAFGAMLLVIGNVSLDRARLENKKGNWAGAVTDADRAVRWLPWSSWALQERGRAEVGLFRRGEARTDFLDAIAKTSDDYSLWSDLASASDPREAVTAIERAVALNPTDEELAQLLRTYRAAAAKAA